MSSVFQRPAGSTVLTGVITHVAGVSSYNPRFTVSLDQTDGVVPTSIYAWAATESFHQAAVRELGIGTPVVVDMASGTPTVMRVLLDGAEFANGDPDGAITVGGYEARVGRNQALLNHGDYETIVQGDAVRMERKLTGARGYAFRLSATELQMFGPAGGLFAETGVAGGALILRHKDEGGALSATYEVLATDTADAAWPPDLPFSTLVSLPVTVNLPDGGTATGQAVGNITGSIPTSDMRMFKTKLLQVDQSGITGQPGVERAAISAPFIDYMDVDPSDVLFAHGLSWAPGPGFVAGRVVFDVDYLRELSESPAVIDNLGAASRPSDSRAWVFPIGTPVQVGVNWPFLTYAIPVSLITNELLTHVGGWLRDQGVPVSSARLVRPHAFYMSNAGYRANWIGFDGNPIQGHFAVPPVPGVSRPLRGVHLLTDVATTPGSMRVALVRKPLVRHIATGAEVPFDSTSISSVEVIALRVRAENLDTLQLSQWSFPLVFGSVAPQDGYSLTALP